MIFFFPLGFERGFCLHCKLKIHVERNSRKSEAEGGKKRTSHYSLDAGKMMGKCCFFRMCSYFRLRWSILRALSKVETSVKITEEDSFWKCVSLKMFLVVGTFKVKCIICTRCIIWFHHTAFRLTKHTWRLTDSRSFSAFCLSLFQEAFQWVGSTKSPRI